MESERPDASREIGKCAAILSMVEVGLGSIFHALHVPTSGQWLSLNQAFWLARLTFRSKSRTAAITASNVTACLKSLSPAGKRLSPMLAISAQGGLFGTGTLLFGPNVVGASAGAVLLSFWAFVHPILVYYVIFGRTLIAAYAALFEKCREIFHFTSQQAIYAIIFIVLGKAVLAVITVAFARWLPESYIDRYQERLLGIARKSAVPAITPHQSGTRAKSGTRAAARGALRDLFHPFFLISLALTALFFVESESSRAAMIWGLLRPVAAGFILFFAVRILPLEPLIAWFEKNGFGKFALALRFARSELVRNRDSSRAPS